MRPIRLPSLVPARVRVRARGRALILVLALASAALACQQPARTSDAAPAAPPPAATQQSAVQPPAVEAPAPYAAAPAAEDTTAERQADLARREAEVAEREAAVARREAQAATHKPSVKQDARPSAKPAPPPAASEPTAETPAPAAAETPVPAEPETPAPRRPRTVEVTVPAGTMLDVEIEDGLSSATSQAGDTFRARVTQDVLAGDWVAIPAGSTIYGSVRQAVPLKKIGGTARLDLDFDRVELPTGESADIAASFAGQGANETKKDAATIGGAAAAGAILGRVIDKRHKGKGTILGAILGAAAGTAIAANTKGEEVELPAGSVVGLRLDRAVDLTLRR